MQKIFVWKENIPTSWMRSPSLHWERRTMAEASGGFLEEVEGEADSVKSEMMVASSDQLTVGRWGFCDMTAHYCRATTGVNMLLHTAF
jgi:hypothetical protein